MNGILYEWNEEEKKIDFSHNPFSMKAPQLWGMPQGGFKALEEADALEKKLSMKAYQYDIVCNGVEFSSGAICNHTPNVQSLFHSRI